ncbi:transporter [Parahaliea aestuarii]|uniref:Transporter n=1 Tax=Parahaliea aestuarii TaxID=1852021 RepID=A0A5C8ZTP3_9GAMM|nr:transporter [Parahaliea aestuarii]TXS91169.1 transporter [Parahaliea aestuarii]
MRFAACCAAYLLAGPGSLAQDLEPRSYTNLPVKQTFLALGYARSEGDLSPTPSSPLQNAEMTIEAGVLALARSFELAGDSAKFDIAASRVCYEGSAIFEGEFATADRCEYGDPSVKLTWNFYGAPALELQDFGQWQPGLVVGASLQATVPLGTYTARHLINAGTNRWMLRPGLGMSYRVGRWYIDLQGSVRVFEDNDDNFRGTLLEQDPIYSLQSHLIYMLGRGAWISANLNYFDGGETYINGNARDDQVENSRLGVTLSFPLSAKQSLKLSASTGVLTRVGNDFDTASVVWLYRF